MHFRSPQLNPVKIIASEVDQVAVWCLWVRLGIAQLGRSEYSLELEDTQKY